MTTTKTQRYVVGPKPFFVEGQKFETGDDFGAGAVTLEGNAAKSAYTPPKAAAFLNAGHVQGRLRSGLVVVATDAKQATKPGPKSDAANK